MATKSAISQLDRQLRELEAAKAADLKTRYVPLPGELLLSMLEGIFHPALTRMMDATERRYWWAGFELLRLLSRLRSLHAHFGYLESLPTGVRASFIEWHNELCESPTYPPWCPFNEFVLHEFKFRTNIRHPIDWPGVKQAEQIDHLLAAIPCSPRCSPWQKGFPADRSTWPADIRETVEQRLAASGSMTPADPPPFDWADVPVYQFGFPFSRDRDGRPTQEAFDKFDREFPPDVEDPPVRPSPIAVVHPNPPASE